MKPVVVHSRAQAQITDAATAYERARPGLGREFVDEVGKILRHAMTFPGIAQLIDGQARRAVIHRFPFCVIYRDEPDRVEVLCVFPTRADPQSLLAELSAAAKPLK